MRKHLIYPNEVVGLTSLSRRRFWGFTELSGSGEELRLNFRLVFNCPAARGINHDLQNKLIKFFETEGYIVKRVQGNHDRKLRTILKQAGVESV